MNHPMQFEDRCTPISSGSSETAPEQRNAKEILRELKHSGYAKPVFHFKVPFESEDARTLFEKFELLWDEQRYKRLQSILDHYLIDRQVHNLSRSSKRKKLIRKFERAARALADLTQTLESWEIQPTIGTGAHKIEFDESLFNRANSNEVFLDFLPMNTLADLSKAQVKIESNRAELEALPPLPIHGRRDIALQRFMRDSHELYTKAGGKGDRVSRGTGEKRGKFVNFCSALLNIVPGGQKIQPSTLASYWETIQPSNVRVIK